MPFNAGGGRGVGGPGGGFYPMPTYGMAPPQSQQQMMQGGSSTILYHII